MGGKVVEAGEAPADLEPDKLNEYFSLVGELLASKQETQTKKPRKSNNLESLFLRPTSIVEVSRTSYQKP